MQQRQCALLIKLIIGILVVAGIWWLVKCQCVNIKALTPAAIRDYIQSFGRLAALVYIVAYALNTVSLIPPIGILSLTAGLAFGMVWGGIYLMIGAMLGTSATFFIARYFGRSLVERLIKGRMNDLDKKLERNGFLTVLFFRVVAVPGVSWEVLNYVSGLSKIKYRDYLTATFFGLVPGVVVAAIFGDSIGSISSAKDIFSPKLLIAAGLYILLAAIPVFCEIIRKRRVKSKKA